MTVPTTLYLATNLVNGKMYVGVTSRALAVRWKQHVKDAKYNKRNYKFHNAIQHYGASLFSVEALHEYNARPDAEHAETSLIANLELQTVGYNSAPGGEGSPVRGKGHTAESRAKISASHKEIMKDPAARTRVADALRGRKRPPGYVSPRRGIKFPAETRAKMSASHLGKKRSPETCERMSASQKGRTFSEAQRSRMAAGQARRFARQAFTDASFPISGPERIKRTVLSSYPDMGVCYAW